MRVGVSRPREGSGIAVAAELAEVRCAAEAVRIRMARVGHGDGARNIFRGGCNDLDANRFLVGLRPSRSIRVERHYRANQDSASMHSGLSGTGDGTKA
jgi:hypothetical protein